MEDNLRILKPYLRGFPLIVLSMVIAVMAARKYLNYVTPMYESTAKLKLADIHEGVPGSNLFKDLDVFASSNKIAGEIEVIKSAALLNNVLDSLDFGLEVYRIGSVRQVELYHDAPFLIDAQLDGPRGYDKKFLLTIQSRDSFLLTLPDAQGVRRARFGQVVSTPFGQFTLRLNQALMERKPDLAIVDHYAFEYLSRARQLDKVNTHLDIVSVDKDVAVIRISYRSPVPEKAAAFVNKITETYIHDYIDVKYKAARTTVDFLEDRIRDVAAKLSQSEDIIQAYRDVNRITNIRQETETDLRKISQLRIQETNLKMSLDAIVALDEYIRQGQDNFLELAPNFQAFTDLLSTEIVKKMQQLQSERHDLLLTYTPEDERVKVIDLKIRDLSAYMTESIANTRRDLLIKYQQLQKDIDAAEKVFIGVPGKEKMLTIMNREFEIYQQSYNFLNEKKIEAEIAQAAKIAFHRIISPAIPGKKPVSPNSAIIIIVSALAALMGSVILITLVHMAKAKVNDVISIESNSGIPVAVLTPFCKTTTDCHRHFLKEAKQLELKGLVRRGQMVTISSGQAREGRGYHIHGISQACTHMGYRVLVVDVAGDILTGSNSGEAITSSHNGITYLAASDKRFEYFTREALAEYIQPYRTTYDLVLVNNEPLALENRGIQWMSLADTNLFILDARRTPRTQIGKVNLLSEEYKLPGLWFILNRSGYNPNVLREIVQGIQIAYAFIQKRLRRHS